MNKVFFRAEDVPMPAWKGAAGIFVKKVLSKLGRKNWEVSVVFCSNRYIRSLNSRYRNMDEPTDVLSFPQTEAAFNAKGLPSGGPFLAGDIAVSLDALEENTRFFNVSEDEELRRLLIHGILHLCGEAHDSNNKREPMLKTQEDILAALAGERIQENAS